MLIQTQRKKNILQLLARLSTKSINKLYDRIDIEGAIDRIFYLSITNPKKQIY